MGAGAQMLMISGLIGLVGIALALSGLRRSRGKTGNAGASALIGLGLAVTVLGGAGAVLAFRIPYFQLREVCAANLRGIHYGLLEYHERYDTYASTLVELRDEGLAMESSMICPFSRRTHYYGYVAGVSDTDPGSWVIAFDLPGDHPNEKRHILYRDAQVKLLDKRAFDREMARFEREFRTARGTPPTVVVSGCEPASRPAFPERGNQERP